MSSILKVGFGRTDITPKLGVRLGGYGQKDRPAENILDQLQSTALYLEQGGCRAVILNLDWICVDEVTTTTIRKAVAELTKVNPDNVTVCTTHTHSSPNTLKAWGWGDIEQEYIDSVIPAIAQSAKNAMGCAEQVKAGFGTTHSEVGINRRSINKDGNYGFSHNPAGLFDPSMTVIRFEGKNGSVGSVVHYGAHNTCMGATRDVTRDWCGVMKDRMEKQTKAPVLFINGSIGDVGPRTNLLSGTAFSAGVGDGIDAVREVGYRAATDALKTWRDIKWFHSDLPLEVAVADFHLPLNPLTPLDTAQEELKKREGDQDKWGNPMAEYLHYQAVVAAHAQPVQTERIFRQTITRIGPAVLIPFPGEVFSEITLRLREYSKFQYTLCSSVTNGCMGYLPAQSARFKPCYAVWMAIAYGAYTLRPDMDEVFIRENLGLMTQFQA